MSSQEASAVCMADCVDQEIAAESNNHLHRRLL